MLRIARELLGYINQQPYEARALTPTTHAIPPSTRTGQECVERELSAPSSDDPEVLGRRLAAELRVNGAAELLASFGAASAGPVDVSAAPRRPITYGSLL